MSAKPSISNSNRLQLEDIEAIKILKARYGYYCDDSYDPDGISSLSSRMVYGTTDNLDAMKGRTRSAISSATSRATRSDLPCICS